MKFKELPGWESAVGGAREVYSWVAPAAFEVAGEREAPPAKTFVCGPNEAYVEACRTGLAQLRDGRPAGTMPKKEGNRA
jgi:hypothetical protein